MRELSELGILDSEREFERGWLGPPGEKSKRGIYQDLLSLNNEWGGETSINSKFLDDDVSIEIRKQIWFFRRHIPCAIIEKTEIDGSRLTWQI